MRKCNRCGGQITFRVVDGQTIPIHLSGRCVDLRGGSRPTKLEILTPATMKFDAPKSYVNPNAKCPVCSQRVFFFQSENGGRVFFDDLGWPWPKHGCTDRAATQKNQTIYAPTEQSSRTGQHWSKSFVFFKLLHLYHKGVRLQLRLKEIPANFVGILRAAFLNTEHSYLVSESELDRAKVSQIDFRNAHSFLISKVDALSSRPYIHFVSASKGAIVTVQLEKIE